MQKEKTKERVLREKPVRALEPRRPWLRRLPAQDEGPPAYRPTFDLSDADRSIRSTIRSLENRWQDAIKAHDIEALEKLLADDFVGASASGRTASKTTLLRRLRDDKNVYRSANAQKMEVRVIAPGHAIITGIARESGQRENGERFRAARRFTDTWRERDGRWVCTRSEVAELSEK